jgi:hypothetical protein
MQRCETVLRRPALLLRAAQLEAVTGSSGAAHTACHALIRLCGNRRTPDMIEFGLPVARRDSADQVRPDDAVLHTPVGDFLMTTSSAVDGDELVRLGLEPA